MQQAASAQIEIPAVSPQPPRSGAARPAGRAKRTGAHARAKVLATGTERESTRGDGEVIELECGITVYPARSEGGRWRAGLEPNAACGPPAAIRALTRTCPMRRA
jgi:hypothetical protein